MADSDVTVSGLVAKSGVRSIALTWEISDPHQDGGLPYLQYDQAEVYASATNDRNAATKIGEGYNSYIHEDLDEEETRYYWLLPRNKSGYYGDWFPNSLTSSVSEISGMVKLIRAARMEAGTMEGTEITGVTVVGATVSTAELTDFPRVEMNGPDQSFYLYDEFGNLTIWLGGTGLQAEFNSYLDPKVGYFRNFNGPGGGLVNMALNAASGGYCTYAVRGTYGPFTGSHDGLIAKEDAAEIGDVLVDKRLLATGGISDTTYEVMRSSQAYQVGAIGVLRTRFAISADAVEPASGLDPMAYAGTHDRIVMNAVGEGMIAVTGSVERGDLLVTSDVPGKAMKQNDNIIRNYTVARARETSSGGLVPCVYLSG